MLKVLGRPVATAGSRWAPTRRSAGPCPPDPGRPRPCERRAVDLTFLGGLGQIGRNCAALEIEGQVCSSIDCGQMFADDTDARRRRRSFPTSPTSASKPAASIGCIATHGHEDHIGALPYVLRDLSFPVYGTRVHARPRAAQARPKPVCSNRAELDRGRVTTSGGASAASTASSCRSRIRRRAAS